MLVRDNPQLSDPLPLGAALLVGLFLAACTPTVSNPPEGGAESAPAVAAAPAPGPAVGTAPPGSRPAPAAPPGPCEPDIESFRSILDNDVSIGRLDRNVYRRATADVGQASAACAAGRVVQARAILLTTKRNYGYE